MKKDILPTNRNFGIVFTIVFLIISCWPLLKNGDIIHIDAKKGTINVDLSRKELLKRKKKWKPKRINFGNGTLWKYAQTVGPAYLGASTHPGGKEEVKCYADI